MASRKRKLAAKKGALVRKARAGVRGALAELERLDRKRANAVRAEKRERKKRRPASKPKAPSRPKRSSKSARLERELAEARAEAERLRVERRRAEKRAEAARRRAKAEAKRLREERRREKEERAARIRKLHEEAVAAGFAGRGKHAPYREPPPRDLRVVEDALRERRYMGLPVHKPRMTRTKDGFMMTGFVIDPATDEEIQLRGYEIRTRTEADRGDVIEKSYHFWGNREALDEHDPREWFETDLYAGLEREPNEDMIVAWADAHHPRAHEHVRKRLTKICRSCNTSNPPQRVRCKNCKARLPRHAEEVS